MRRYLDKIGVKRKDRPEAWRTGFRRRMKCWFERRVYGFDATETYSLDYTWYLWLYERLKMFRKYATKTVDLTESMYEYDGNKYSLLELIDKMIHRLEYRLNPKFSYDDLDENDVKYVNEIMGIWAVVCNSMWW